jgi:hypothetical protein
MESILKRRGFMNCLIKLLIFLLLAFGSFNAFSLSHGLQVQLSCSTGIRSCGTDADCSDNDPCNGDEQCSTSLPETLNCYFTLANTLDDFDDTISIDLSSLKLFLASGNKIKLIGDSSNFSITTLNCDSTTCDIPANTTLELYTNSYIVQSNDEGYIPSVEISFNDKCDGIPDINCNDGVQTSSVSLSNSPISIVDACLQGAPTDCGPNPSVPSAKIILKNSQLDLCETSPPPSVSECQLECGFPEYVLDGSSSTGATSFEWFKDGIFLNGFTTNTYALGALDLEDSGTIFGLRVTNDTGTDTANMTLLVADTISPTIEANLVAKEGYEEKYFTATFSATDSCDDDLLVVANFIANNDESKKVPIKNGQRIQFEREDPGHFAFKKEKKLIEIHANTLCLNVKATDDAGNEAISNVCIE